MKLTNKVALVTGAAQGLGKSIAIAMAKEGANVTICDINNDAMLVAAKEIEPFGVQCQGIVCDVSSSSSVAGMFQQVKDRFGTLHILVNNAALVQNRPVEEERRNRFYDYLTTPMPRQSLGLTKNLTDEEWHRFWGVNVHGVFYCTRETLKLMEEQKYGKIINIGSTAGISVTAAHSSPYAATKAAVASFTKNVAMEVAGAGIYVNAIACGAILTPPMKAYLGRCSEEEKNRLFQMIPLGRLAEPEEYASLAVYLASDEHYLVGQVISPNGGMVI
jgi:3-oxoacyl-[acyl-carrier protein] reductase